MTLREAADTFAVLASLGWDARVECDRHVIEYGDGTVAGSEADYTVIALFAGGKPSESVIGGIRRLEAALNIAAVSEEGFTVAPRPE